MLPKPYINFPKTSVSSRNVKPARILSCANREWKMEKGLVFCTGNIETAGKIYELLKQ